MPCTCMYTCILKWNVTHRSARGDRTICIKYAKCSPPPPPPPPPLLLPPLQTSRPPFFLLFLLLILSFLSPLKHCQLLHENSGCGFQFYLQTAIKKMIVALCPKINKEKLYKKESREGNRFPKKLYEKLARRKQSMMHWVHTAAACSVSHRWLVGAASSFRRTIFHPKN